MLATPDTQNTASNTALERLQVAAQRLLDVIDQAPIRSTALACGAELYESAALLKDALHASAEGRP